MPKIQYFLDTYKIEVSWHSISKAMKIFLATFLFVAGFLNAQNPYPFKDEVASLEKKYDTLWDSSRETIVFTGSSSIRMWHDLEDRFPAQQIVNTGFGGSQASDLFTYSGELISRFNPKKVFIYEGDNDIWARKRVNQIIGTIKEIIDKLRVQDPDLSIVIISAKPSISRWKRKRRYMRLNRKFNRISEKDPLTTFADVWNPMLDGKQVKQDIFIEDGLHMNPKGYEIWYNALKNLVEDTTPSKR